MELCAGICITSFVDNSSYIVDYIFTPWYSVIMARGLVCYGNKTLENIALIGRVPYIGPLYRGLSLAEGN